MKLALWLILLLLPQAIASDDGCKSKLSASDPQLHYMQQLDVILDLERDRDHFIAAFYNYRNAKSAFRPFKQREELRYFLRQQEGADWLERGTALLSDLSTKKKTRNSLSANEKRLADGTLLYLRHEWLFENADIRDEKNRAERIRIELEIAVIEEQIDQKKAAIGDPPLHDRTYNDDDPEKFKKELERIEVMIDTSKIRMSEIKNLIDLLARDVYSSDVAAVESATIDVEAYWQRLGYEETPY